MRNRTLAGMTLALTALVTFSPLAGWAEQADGIKNTYISNWMVGKESSTWDDPNHHDGRTSLSHYAKCSPAPDSAGVIPRSATYNLRKVRRFQPDVNSGDRTLSCARTGSAYYGRMPAGTYRFRLVGLTGGSPTWLKLSVRDFRTRW